MIRALSRPESNICICGKLKSGRFESTALACTILNIKIFYLQVTKNYNVNDFYNDLKLAMQTCALENEIAILYISDMWVNYLNEILKWCEAILEGNLVNNNLFGDDLETLSSGLGVQHRIHLQNFLKTRTRTFQGYHEVQICFDSLTKTF